MTVEELYRQLRNGRRAKLALIVLDGVGDVALAEQGTMTALEAARTPNLDRLVQMGCAQGRLIPVAPGVTPGSGPGHLALFGYDPLQYQVGRGVIEALGLGIELEPGDIAVRCNFCTIDDQGIVVDRRAGRLPTEECRRLCELLSANIKNVGTSQVFIYPGKEHRFVVVFRDKGLEAPLTDTDPGREGLPIQPAQPTKRSSAKQRKLAKVIDQFYKLALPLLKNEPKANAFLMRGIDQKPDFPLFGDMWKLSAVCLAVYPMYKGLARLIGMEVVEGLETIEDQFRKYVELYDRYDFFYIHYKNTDKYGEDGNFEAKKQAIEQFDAALPIFLERLPDVVVITGDHSTPCVVKGHSWHPVPVLLHSRYSGSDKLERFTETGANLGSLGIMEAKYLMPIMMANAKLFDKFGA